MLRLTAEAWGGGAGQRDPEEERRRELADERMVRLTLYGPKERSGRVHVSREQDCRLVALPIRAHDDAHARRRR